MVEKQITIAGTRLRINRHGPDGYYIAGKEGYIILKHEHPGWLIDEMQAPSSYASLIEKIILAIRLLIVDK